jgi:hypothetical protein
MKEMLRRVKQETLGSKKRRKRKRRRRRLRGW